MKIIEKIKGMKKRILGHVTAITTAAMLAPANVYAVTVDKVTWKGGTDVDSLVGGIMGMMLTIARYAGMALTVWGIVKAVMAFKDDNTNEMTQGIRLAVVGAVLVALKSVLSALGLVG